MACPNFLPRTVQHGVSIVLPRTIQHGVSIVLPRTIQHGMSIVLPRTILPSNMAGLLFYHEPFNSQKWRVYCFTILPRPI